MGHLHNTKELYRDLQRRLDKTQSGLAQTEEVESILSHLYTAQEARIAAKMPVTPRKIGTIERRTGLSRKELQVILERMAEKGLVFDFTHPQKGTYYMLAPPVIGFFEMSMMRVRMDIDQKEVARLLSLYMHERDAFAKEVARGLTPLGRALVHETSLSDQAQSDILDFERATALIEDAEVHSISLCYCRHKKSHLGEACAAPQDVCMQLGNAADFSVRRGHARKAAKQELLDKLQACRELGLVQISDNVQNKPAYICNCCGCCCGQLVAINRHGINHAVNTSQFLAETNVDSCTGCGKCARACPVQAIALRARAPHEKLGTNAKMAAQIDDSVCLGCGVCVPTCTKSKSLRMVRRHTRVLTPENTLERVIRMALGRGHLHDVLFDELDGPTAAFLNRVTGAVETMPVVQRLLLNETLRSRFVGFLCEKAKREGRDGGAGG